MLSGAVVVVNGGTPTEAGVDTDEMVLSELNGEDIWGE